HLAHGREQRQPPVTRLHGLVGDADGAGLAQPACELRRRRQVQVGEQDLARREALVLAVERLLHLQHHLGVVPDRVDARDGGAGRLVLGVFHGAARAGAGLDEHLVPAPAQLDDARRGQRHARLVRLDLLDDTDPHSTPPSWSGCAIVEPETRAASIRPIVTPSMPSRSATEMCSEAVWISAMPLHTFTQGTPAALNTFASAPPPDSM